MEDLKPFEIYQEIEGVEVIAQGVLSLIMTQLLEMPYFPFYGSEVRAEVDGPNSLAVPKIKASIAQALTDAIPGVTLKSVTLEIVDTTHQFQVVFAYDGTEYTVTT
jgi:phage baseplate assembly protein W